MLACVERYHAQAKSALSTIPAFASLQDSACADLLKLQFPRARDEAWKYTSLKHFLDQDYVPGQVVSVDVASLALAPIEAYVVSMDGECLSPTKTLPAGVMVCPLAQALIDDPVRVQACLGTLLQHEHGLSALNTAMLSRGLWIYIPPDVVLDEPIYIVHTAAQAQEALYVRHLIYADERSVATVIEDYIGQITEAYMTNAVTETFLMKGSALTHYKIQREGLGAFHVGQMLVKQCEQSQFYSQILHVGGRVVRHDLCVELDEPFTKCSLNGLYSPHRGQHMDQHVRVNHAVPDGSSEQDYRGLISHQSRAVFDGQVKVAKDAQRTTARQQNKNILLSGDARVDTKPQLDILADDVVCSHGATVGRLDAEALFYLSTRGLPQELAISYLIQAFVASQFSRIPHAGLAAWMSDLLLTHLGITYE